jgi:predicted small secreted protein
MKKSFIFGLLTALVALAIFTGCNKKEGATEDVQVKIEDKQSDQEVKVAEEKGKVTKTNEKKQASKETEYEKEQKKYWKMTDEVVECTKKYGGGLITPPECEELDKRRDEQFNKMSSMNRVNW